MSAYGRRVEPNVRAMPVGGGETLAQHSFAFVDADGYLTSTLTPTFAGVVRDKGGFVKPLPSAVDNSAGADGDVWADVWIAGDFIASLAAAQSDVGATVYASDSTTASLSSTGNTAIGVLVGLVEGSAVPLVAIKGLGE